MNIFYPEQRPAMRLSVIRREVALPEEASGVVAVTVGQRVDVRDVVARGLVPGRFVVVDAQSFFKLKRPEDLAPLLLVNVDDEVDEIKPIAGQDSARGRRLFSPVAGRVAAITEGNIIIEQLNAVIDLEAGLRGQVAEVYNGRGIVVEATGARIQGVWGNGGRAIAVIANEGQNALENTSIDALGSRYSNTVVVLRRPISEDILDAAATQGVSALIAPSMPYSLVELAVLQPYALILAEGFGAARMNRGMSQVFQELEGLQVTVDASQPLVWEARRPEVVMNVQPRQNETPARPSPNQTLRAGMAVRIFGGDHSGMLGTVVNLPNEPLLLDNGLRVPCALVELTGTQRAAVPLANLEVMG